MGIARLGLVLSIIGMLAFVSALEVATGVGAPVEVARAALQATGTVTTTATVAATATVTATTPAATSTPELTATATMPAATATPEATATGTPAATATGTATVTATASPTGTATATATPIPPPGPPTLPSDPASVAPFRLYVPLAYKAAGAWDSGIQVQNVGGSDATVYVSFFNQGSLVETEQPATIGVGASKTYFLPSLNNLPQGFAGSAVIGASGPVAAVVNSTNYNVNGSGKSSTTAYNAIGLAEAATTVALPALRWGSVLHVQNAGNAQTTVQITTYNVGGIQTNQQSVTLNPNGSFAQDMGFFRSEAGGSAVSAIVTSTGSNPQPIAVTLWGDVQSPAGVPMSLTFPSITKPAPNLVAPLLMRRPTGWATEMAIQNVGSQTAQVQIQYYDDKGNLIQGASENVFIPVNGAYVSRQADQSALPGDFVGSAVINSTNGQALALAVLQTNPNVNQGTNYTGLELNSAGTTLYAPLLMKAHNGWNTGLQVQNVGNAPTSVTVTYYDTNNQVVSSQAGTVPANSATTFYTPDAPGLPADYVGSAVVTSGGGQRLVGVVNEVNYLIGNGGDNSLTYVLVGGQ